MLFSIIQESHLKKKENYNFLNKDHSWNYWRIKNARRTRYRIGKQFSAKYFISCF